MDWQISDSDGQALFDSGYILLSSELTAPSVLAEALSRFRDYSLIQIALPVGFELEGAMDDEARAVLGHCYVIAEALDDRFKYFIVSPKLFTAGNFIEALLVVAEEKTKTALLKKLSGFAQVSSVDFYRRNLFKLLP